MTQARNLSRLLNKKLQTFKYTATSGQTTFSDSDDAGLIMSYTPENMLVTYNGVVLESGSEYTATNGTSVVLDAGADSAAEVNVYAFESVSLGGYVPSTGGTFGGNVGVTGNLTVDTNTLFVDATNNRVGVGTSSPAYNLQVQAVSPIIAAQSSGANGTRLLLSAEDGAVYIGNTYSSSNVPIIFTQAGTSGGVERMRIDTAGRVTKPAQPSFSAWNLATSSQYATALDTWNTADAGLNNWGSPRWVTEKNQGTAFNTSNGRYTAPITGTYKISAACTWFLAGNNTYMNILVNGAQTGTYSVVFGSSVYIPTVINRVMQLNAGDYIELAFYVQSSGNFIPGSSYLQFNGYLVG